MFCSKCGTQNADGLNFCAKCGAPLNANSQQQVYQQPYQQPQQPQTVPGKGQGIAAMVLGIISLVFCCVWYICLPCGIIGLALGAIASKKAKAVGASSGVATAGIVCSCIGLALMVLMYVLALIGLASFENALEDAFRMY